MQAEGAKSTSLLLFDIFYELVYTKEFTGGGAADKIHMSRNSVGNGFGKFRMIA